MIYKTKWGLIDEYFSNKNGFSILLKNSNDLELIKIYNDSDIGKEDFKKFFLKLSPESKDVNSLIKDYKDGYAKFKIINTELLNLLLKFKEKNIKLFGFTDTKKEHYEANIDSGIFEGFEEVFTSFKFGYLKSQGESFILLTEELKKYNLTPKECLFIDDQVENIERAKEKEYNTFYYENFPDVSKIRLKFNELFN